MKNSKGFIPLVALIYGSVVVFALVAGYLGYKVYHQPILGTPSSTASSNPTTPVQTPIPTSVVTPDPDPMVTCNIDSKCGGTKIVRNSICNNTYSYCCYLRDGTSVLTSKYKCDHYYDVQTQVPTQGVQQVQAQDPIMTCILSTGTYQLPVSVCNQYMKSDSQIIKYNPIMVTPPSQITPVPVVPVDHQKLQQDCINQENKTYADLLSEYQRVWGHPPTDDFMTRQHDTNLANCSQL